ncbi:hypothetical protein ACSZMR_13550 [Aeromonas veronii]
MNPFDIDQSNASEVRKVEQAQYSRSDLATTRRALSDLESQAEKLTQQVHYHLAKPGQVSLEDFQAGWAQREKLNQISGQIDSLRQSISEILPSVVSSPRLSVEEREQIRGLYQSRLYTQQQIAEQYGVSQPTVGDIVRKRDERNGD